MNFAEIENLRLQTVALLPRLSGMPKVILLNHFYDTLLSTKNEFLINAFCLEFFDEFLSSFEHYNSSFYSPDKSNDYLTTLEKLSKINLLSDFYDRISVSVEHIKKNTISFSVLLNSIAQKNNGKGELYFPLIGTITIAEKTLCYNSIEKVSIKISTAKHKDKFVFVPSNYKKEKLEEQAKISFELAKNYIKERKHKLSKHHEVLIYFENLSADYDGNSLGIALTIGFIEQLSIIYNLPYVTKIKGNIVSTGGISINGELISLGDSITSQKTCSLFYSSFNTFIIPKADEQASLQAIVQLKKEFPNRQLRIVAVESLNDLLERRSIIELKKQSKIVRSARFIKTNWVASFLFLLLTLILIFVYVKDFDDNPASFEASGQALLIKNKSGKTLWMKTLHIDHKMLPSDIYEKAQYRIIDVDNDGANEVIVTNEIFTDKEDIAQRNRVACFNKDGSLRWKYLFKDSVRSERENLDNDYGPAYIIGTKLSGNKRVIYLSSRNGKSYSSAIYSLDLKTGNRVGNTLWNSGHIIDGTLYDLDGDKKEELIYTFSNNGLHRAGIAVIKLENATGQGPSANEYLFLNIKIAHFITYVLTPRTDYNVYIQERNNGIVPFSLLINKRDQVISFATSETADYPGHGLCYRLNFDLRTLSVFAIDEFTGMRDKLVNEHKLKPPFTDTNDYYDFIKSQILFWNGKEFVKKSNLN